MAFITWVGTEAFNAAIAAKEAAMPAAMRDATIEAAHVVERAMKIRAREGGRHKKGTPTPAQPGGGPAVISGTLGRSIVVRPGTVGLMFTAKIGPTAVYGRRVELEYDYPYAGPGFEDAAPLIPPIFAAAAAKAHSS